ncbi:MAG: hypothetical protein EA399_11520 [Desulfovibrionales bacterium]|nr:MAG: hypothetical protein EA399_11520 [Desulfovibrionales bacterium]
METTENAHMLAQSEILAMYAVFYASIDNHQQTHRFRHFVITDLGSDHLPWTYIVDNGLFMEKVASGSLFHHDFIAQETLPIYLTPNLWTCQCTDGRFIHDLEVVSCIRCMTYHRDIGQPNTLPRHRGTWRPHLDRYPYWNAIITESCPDKAFNQPTVPPPDRFNPLRQ